MGLYPASVLSYYPTYALLDEVVSYGNYKNINIFVDLKNCLQSLYMEHAVHTIVNESTGTMFIDTSIFSSVVSFISFHKIYSIKRNLNIKYYIFFETGTSYYHLNINPQYKKNRKTDELYGLDKEKRDRFFEVVQKNLQLIDNACNKMPDVKVIRMANLDADFIPYYLTRNNLVQNDDQTVNITYSGDHDMFQNVKENCFVYKKHASYKKIIKPGEISAQYCKFPSNVPDEYYPLIMAVDGDPGDNITGIKGLGIKTIVKIIDELVYMCGGMNQLYENVFRSDPIFINQPRNMNKYIDKIIEEETNNKKISNNLKLVSYEILSRFMDDPIDTEMIKKKDHLMNILESNKIYSYKSLLESLTAVGVMFADDSLENIYYKSQ